MSSVHADEPARIQVRYGAMLIDVSGPAGSAERRRLDVLQVEDLVRVAEQQGRMILHTRLGPVHHYSVSDGENDYRYSTQERTPVLRPAEEEGAQTDVA